MLNLVSSHLDATLSALVAQYATTTGVEVVFADPSATFSGHNLCSTNFAIHGLRLVMTPGENADFTWPTAPHPVSNESVHPNFLGTTYYGTTMTNALVGVY